MSLKKLGLIRIKISRLENPRAENDLVMSEQNSLCTFVYILINLYLNFVGFEYIIISIQNLPAIIQWQLFLTYLLELATKR